MSSGTEHDEALLKAHRLHAGVYRRVADKLGVDPSYVSLVAAGKREASEIRSAILEELRKIQRITNESAAENRSRHSRLRATLT